MNRVGLRRSVSQILSTREFMSDRGNQVVRPTTQSSSGYWPSLKCKHPGKGWTASEVTKGVDTRLPAHRIEEDLEEVECKFKQHTRISRGPIAFLIYFLPFLPPFFLSFLPYPSYLLPLSTHTHAHTQTQVGIFTNYILCSVNGLTNIQGKLSCLQQNKTFQGDIGKDNLGCQGQTLELAGWLGQFCCSIADAFMTAHCMISVLFTSCFSCAFKYLYEIGCGIPTRLCCNALVRCWFSALTSIEEKGRN